MSHPLDSRTALRAAAAVVVVALGAAVPVLGSVVSPADTGGPSGRYPLGLWLNRDEPPVTQGLPSGRHIPGSSGEITAQLRTVNGKAVITAVGQQPGLGEGTYLGPAPLPDGWLATIGVPPRDSAPRRATRWSSWTPTAGRCVVAAAAADALHRAPACACPRSSGQPQRAAVVTGLRGTVPAQSLSDYAAPA